MAGMAGYFRIFLTATQANKGSPAVVNTRVRLLLKALTFESCSDTAFSLCSLVWTQQSDPSQAQICQSQLRLTTCPARTSYIKHSSSTYVNSLQCLCQSFDHWLGIYYHCSTCYSTWLNKPTGCRAGGGSRVDKGCVLPTVLLSQQGLRTVDPCTLVHPCIINMRCPCRQCTDDTRLNHSQEAREQASAAP